MTTVNEPLVQDVITYVLENFKFLRCGHKDVGLFEMKPGCYTNEQLDELHRLWRWTVENEVHQAVIIAAQLMTAEDEDYNMADRTIYYEMKKVTE